MSSPLLRMMPENSFDVHHLRTFKISLVAWLLRVQGYSPHASELINQLVFALNQTFREVELSYLVWRNERVQTILKHGFQYARARISTAIWRRDHGKPAAAFPHIYSAFYVPGAHSAHQPQPQPQQHPHQPVNYSLDQHASSWHASQYQANPFATTVPGDGIPQGPNAQPYSPQNPYGHRGEPVAPHPQAQPGSPSGGYTPWHVPPEGASGAVRSERDFPPPPYPPPFWKPPDPVPGSPPVSSQTAMAVDVATRFLEAVNKSVNVCVDLNAM